MNQEQLEQIKEYEWDKFCRRYPVACGKNWLSKWMILFSRYHVQRMIWENGFLQGWIQAHKTL